MRSEMLNRDKAGGEKPPVFTGTVIEQKVRPQPFLCSQGWRSVPSDLLGRPHHGGGRVSSSTIVGPGVVC